MLTMPKVVKKLAVFDIDGTLAPPGKGATNETMHRLNELHDIGITIAISSGQSKEYCTGFMRNIGITNNLIIISENGSAIYDVDTKLHYALPEAKTGQEGIKKVYDFVNRQFTGLMISKDNTGGFLYPLEKEYTLTIGCIDPRTDMDSVRTLKNKIEEFVKLLPEGERPSVHLNTTSLDVVTNGVDKEKALRYVKQEYGVLTRDVLSFGDDHRDKNMANESSFLLLVGPTVRNEEISRINVKRFDTIDQALRSEIVQKFVSPEKVITPGFMLRINPTAERERATA